MCNPAAAVYGGLKATESYMNWAQARKNARAQIAAAKAMQKANIKAAQKAFRGQLADLVARGHQEAAQIFRHGEKKAMEMDRKGGMMVTSAGESNVIAGLQDYSRARHRLQVDVAQAAKTSRRNIHSMARDAQATAWSRMIAGTPNPISMPSWAQGITGMLAAGAEGAASGDYWDRHFKWGSYAPDIA